MERDVKGPVFSSSNDVYSYYYPLVRDFKRNSFALCLMQKTGYSGTAGFPRGRLQILSFTRSGGI